MIEPKEKNLGQIAMDLPPEYPSTYSGRPTMRPDFAKALASALILWCLAPLAVAGPEVALSPKDAGSAVRAAAKVRAKPVAAAQHRIDLTVELRQVKEGQEEQNGSGAPSGYTVSTAPHTAEFAAQQVRVGNGEKASLRITQSMPMQWVQKIESQSATLSVPSASASSSTGAVTQAITWMEAGQSLTVTPHWPGGKQAVKIDIEAQASIVDERTTSDLPASTRQHFSTTVHALLRQWVTIATTGSAPKPGSYSSNGSAQGRKLIQIRVLPN